MDINAKAGTKVVFLGKHGSDIDLKHAITSGLVAGNEYEVEYVDIHSWISFVHLKEFIGRGFNTVMFKESEAEAPAKMERPTWDEYFLQLARTVAIRSHDKETKVGAVIVKDNRIISTGYNGFPPGQPDHLLPSFGPEKYPYMIHAELNAIASCSQDLKGSTLYCSLTPCLECAKAIITSGIKRVVAGREYTKSDFSMIEKMLNNSGIKVEVAETIICVHNMQSRCACNE